MRKIWFSLSITIIFAVFVVGCAQMRILDELGLIQAVGYDKLENHRILGTFVLQQVDPNAKEKVQVISDTALTSKGIRIAGNRETSRKLVSGQLRVAIYSEEIAKDGMIELVDTLARDPEIGNMVYLAVGKGKILDILSHRYPEIGNVGSYLHETIKQNINSEQMISPTLHEFLHDFYSEGKDPIIPYLERRGNEIKLLGGALFSRDKMVGTILPERIFFIKLLRDRYQAGSYEMSIPAKSLKKFSKNPSHPLPTDSIYLVIDTINSNPTIKLVDQNRPRFNVSIKLNARLLEVSALIDLSKPEAIREVEKQINRGMTNEVNKLLKILQEKKSDPVGFGEVYRASVRGSQLTTDKWLKLYPQAQFDVQIDTTLIRTGIIE